MRSRRLIALNAALLGALALVTIATQVSDAGAQPAGAGGSRPNYPGRHRGDYCLVSGRTTGGSSSAVYILDSSNQELLALTWDRSREQFVILGRRDVTADARITRQKR